MNRIITPLSQMGAQIESLPGNGCLPLRITGSSRSHRIILLNLLITLENTNSLVTIKILDWHSFFCHMNTFSGTYIPTGDTFTSQISHLILNCSSSQADAITKILKRVFPFHRKIKSRVTY